MLKTVLVSAAMLLGHGYPAHAYQYRICVLANQICSPALVTAPTATAAYIRYRRQFIATTATNVVVTATRRGCSTHSIRRTDLATPNAYGWDKRYVWLTHPNGCSTLPVR
jgi:hypothetical protein